MCEIQKQQQTHHEVSEETLDYIIDDLQVDYKRRYKSDRNILMNYFMWSHVLRIDRVSYWIEKRAIDPWDSDENGRTIFDYYDERIDQTTCTQWKRIDKEVQHYLLSLKDQKYQNSLAPGTIV